jgi:transposase-like protein
MTWKQCLDSEDILIATTIRRHWLGVNHPVCPKCGEDQQLQLVEYMQPVPDWKCRTCKHKFKHEPEHPGKSWKS